MNKRVTKILLVLLLLGIVVGIVVGCVYDNNGTPPPTPSPNLKITVHGAVYYCQRYSMSDHTLTLRGCQGFRGRQVIIRNVQDFLVESYQPTPEPGERG